MNFLFGGGDEAIVKNPLTDRYKKFISRSINVAPFILSLCSALIAVGMVQLFNLRSSVVTGGTMPEFTSDTDNTIAVLLGMLFATELGTRLFTVASAVGTMQLSSYMMPQECIDFFIMLNSPATTIYYTVVDPKLDRNNAHVVTFLSSLYTAASYTLLKNEIHLRWVLLDVVILYHTFLKPYSIASLSVSNTDVFMATFSGSFLHYFVVMLMFSTADSVTRLFKTDLFSKRLKFAPKTIYDNFNWYLESIINENNIHENKNLSELQPRLDKSRLKSKYGGGRVFTKYTTSVADINSKDWAQWEVETDPQGMKNTKSSSHA